MKTDSIRSNRELVGVVSVFSGPKPLHGTGQTKRRGHAPYSCASRRRSPSPPSQSRFNGFFTVGHTTNFGRGFPCLMMCRYVSGATARLRPLPFVYAPIGPRLSHSPTGGAQGGCVTPLAYLSTLQTGVFSTEPVAAPSRHYSIHERNPSLLAWPHPYHGSRPASWRRSGLISRRRDRHRPAGFDSPAIRSSS